MSSIYEKLIDFFYVSIKRIINDLKSLREKEEATFYPDAYLAIKNLNVPFLSTKTKLNLIISLLKRVRYLNINDQITNLEDVISHFDKMKRDKGSYYHMIKKIYKNFKAIAPEEEAKKSLLEKIENEINSSNDFFGSSPFFNQIVNFHLKLAEDLRNISLNSEEDLLQEVSKLEFGFISRSSADKLKQDLISYLKRIYESTDEYNVRPIIKFIHKVIGERIDMFMASSPESISTRIDFINFKEKEMLENVFIGEGFFRSTSVEALVV